MNALVYSASSLTVYCVSNYLSITADGFALDQSEGNGCFTNRFRAFTTRRKRGRANRLKPASYLTTTGIFIIKILSKHCRLYISLISASYHPSEPWEDECVRVAAGALAQGCVLLFTVN